MLNQMRNYFDHMKVRKVKFATQTKNYYLEIKNLNR